MIVHKENIPAMLPTEKVLQLPSSYIREILQAATSTTCISLAGGLPKDSLLPYDHIAQSLQILASDTPLLTKLLQYGSTAGYTPLLDYLRQHYQLSAQTRMLITNGSQQGIDLVARGFLESGTCVVVESPGYLGAIQAFSLTEAEIQGVNQLADGPDLNQLEILFKQGRCRMFYTVPDFHNPSGCCWSLPTRKAVAALCRQHKVLLVEDAPYRELRFRGDPLPMVSEFCPENAIVLRSFSKTAAPGLRLGLLSGPSPLIEPLEKIKQAVDLHSNLPGQYLLLQLLSSDSYQQQKQTLNHHYATQCDHLCRALDTELDDIGHYQPVDGGMFIWFQLNNHCADTLAKVALRNGVAVVPGSVFSVGKEQHHRNALRLNFSHPSPADITRAITTLAGLVKGK